MNCSREANQAVFSTSAAWARLDACRESCRIHNASRSEVSIPDRNPSTMKVALAKSNGSNGSTPCNRK